MNTEVTIDSQVAPGPVFLTWSPVLAHVRLTVADGATDPVPVTLRSRSSAGAGAVVFGTSVSSTTVAQMPLSLPVDGSPVEFFVAGAFGRPSVALNDASIEVVDGTSGQLLSATPLMVRIRKSAIALTDPERNRFLAGLRQLNDSGRFAGFRLVHYEDGIREAHRAQGFLPWHRAYLLDLERELQAIDAAIALPYWRFDRPAPRLFAQAFMGIPDPATNSVRLSSDNPLQFWKTDGVIGFDRRPKFNTQQTSPPSVIGEVATLGLGEPGATYERFRTMEGNPHGSAHMSFNGFLPSLDMAVRDPLFFLLHANVDRLWAKWQWIRHRFDGTDVAAYSAPGSAGSVNAVRIGHNLNDTMWPWNGVTGDPRPGTAPGGGFPATTLTNAPGATPTVASMIDYQGVLDPAHRLGFDYDDVPFEV
jgi:tyrosinase